MKKLLYILLLFGSIVQAQFSPMTGVVASQDATVVFDADYQAILDRATTLVYTKPSAAQQIIQNQLVLDLKSNGIWAKLDVLYVPANDGSDEYGRLNWIVPASNELTKSGTVAWTSNVGFKGNGTSSYVNSNYNPTDDGANYVAGSASMFIYVVTEHNYDTSYNDIMGGYGASTDERTVIYDNNTSLGYHINTNTYTETTDAAVGMLHADRTTTTASYLFVDGVQTQPRTVTATTSIPTSDLFIGARTSNGTASSWSNAEWGVAGFGESLFTEASTLNTLIANYINGI